MSSVLKSTILMTVLCATSSFSHPRAGFYVGAEAGWTKQKGTGTVTQRTPTHVFSSSFSPSSSGTIGMIFSGYESPLSPSFLLGSEIFAGMDSSKFKESDVPDPTEPDDVRINKLSQKYKTGISIIAGTPLSDIVTIYGKAALLNSRFSLQHQVVNSTLAGYSGSTQSKNLLGVEPGVRVKVALTHNLAAQLDANYSFYQTWKTKNFSTVDGLNYCVKVSPRNFALIAGISYKF